MSGNRRNPGVKAGDEASSQTGVRRKSAWVPEVVDPRGAAPLRLGEVLVGAQAHMARRAGALMGHEEWRRIVGTKIASRTRVGRLSRGVLTIKVASSAWSNELTFLRPQILEKLVQSGHDVRALRFAVDQALSASPTPGRKAPRFQEAPPEVLSPELVERLQQIEDPNLRAAVAEAARVSLRRAAAAGRKPE